MYMQSEQFADGCFQADTCAFQKALEESRKELEKEERRRRRERRKQQAEVIEQEQLFSEVEQHKDDITENSASSSEVGYL